MGIEINSSSKIMFDTSFLMPIFHLDIKIPGLEHEIADLLDKEQIIILYSPVSIIEIKWEFFRLIKSRKNEKELQNYYQLGLKAIKADKNAVELPLTDVETNEITDFLRKQGHEDYFDTVIGANAILYAEFFLTLDNGLTQIMKEYYNTFSIDNQDQVVIGNWKDFLDFKL